MNIKANGALPPPCVMTTGSVNTCVQIFPQPKLYTANNGTWYGPGSGPCGALGGDGCPSCCDVKQQIDPSVDILATSAMAIRNDQYKLVQSNYPACVSPPIQYEFFQINQATPIPQFDRADANLNPSLAYPPQGLTTDQLDNFNALYAELQALLASQPSCPGDGNEDLMVNQEDLDNWQFFSQFTGEQNSSWYDFNFDGATDEQDLQIIEQHLGANCMAQ